MSSYRALSSRMFTPHKHPTCRWCIPPLGLPVSDRSMAGIAEKKWVCVLPVSRHINSECVSQLLGIFRGCIASLSPLSLVQPFPTHPTCFFELCCVKFHSKNEQFCRSHITPLKKCPNSLLVKSDSVAFCEVVYLLLLARSTSCLSVGGTQVDSSRQSGIQS